MGNMGELGKRIGKRLLNFILVVWGVVTLSFCLQVFTGTDPAEMIVRKVNVLATEEQIQAVRESLGLDAPFLERYTDYIKGVLTGDLGTAITNRQPVIENIKDAPSCDLYIDCNGDGLGNSFYGAALCNLGHTKRRHFRQCNPYRLYHRDMCPEFLAGPPSAGGFRRPDSHF